ncbi:MAG: orotate phosphoribosyltransferase [Bacillota bacterium]
MRTNTLERKILGWLFETGAIKVSAPDQPFWYTSGLIGPYYCNTHFLYGSEEAATRLLAQIDGWKSQPLECSAAVARELRQQYAKTPLYRQLIDDLAKYLRQNWPLDQIQYISGGERRDWFFSLLPAMLLDKPHLTIFKDRQVVLQYNCGAGFVSDLGGGRVLHISDLITEASSYLRAWIPAIADRGGEIVGTVTIVDRQQGGGEALRRAGVPMQALARIDQTLFAEARERGYVSAEQYQLVLSYLQDPEQSMRNFLLSHPEFLENALQGDAKTAERARRLLDEDLYKLK